MERKEKKKADDHISTKKKRKTEGQTEGKEMSGFSAKRLKSIRLISSSQMYQKIPSKMLATVKED